MSQTITVAQVQQYTANVRMLFQRQGSMLRPFVREEMINAKYKYFERLGPTAAVKKTSRHSTTPQVNSQHSRRRAESEDFEWADLIDPQDELRIVISPQSSYVINAAMALGRALDGVILTAMNAPAFEGETGGSQVSFPGGQVISDGGTGLTIDKLRQAKRQMDVDNVPSSGRHICVSPVGIEQLLNTTEVTSMDFNTVRALVRGELDTFLGFMFHMQSGDVVEEGGLPLSGNVRSAFVWHESAIGLLIGENVVTRISERDDLSYSTQVYARATYGAVRVEDEGVIELKYDESV